MVLQSDIYMLDKQNAAIFEYLKQMKLKNKSHQYFHNIFGCKYQVLT